jgi:hypothetical protein
MGSLDLQGERHAVVGRPSGKLGRYETSPRPEHRLNHCHQTPSTEQLLGSKQPGVPRGRRVGLPAHAPEFGQRFVDDIGIRKTARDLPWQPFRSRDPLPFAPLQQIPIAFFGVGAARRHHYNFSASDARHFCTHAWDQLKVEFREDIDARDEVEAPRTKGKGRGIRSYRLHPQHGGVQKMQIGSDELPRPPRAHSFYAGADLENARIPIKVPRAPQDGGISDHLVRSSMNSQWRWSAPSTLTPGRAEASIERPVP